MKALFICDDKEEWSYIKNLFAAHFKKIDVLCAINADDAIDLLAVEGPFFSVMIEVSIREEEPNDISKKIIDFCGERPIIYMGEMVHLKSRVSNDIYNMHPKNSMVSKPYDISQFTNAVNTSISWSKREEEAQAVEEKEREDLLPMKLRNFYLFKKVPYDVFLELTQTKFIKIIKKNTEYTHATIQSYARRNVKQFYLGKDDYIKFLEEGIKKVSKALDVKGQHYLKYIGLQVKAILLIHQYVRTIGISDDIITLVDKVIGTTDKVFRSNLNNWKTLITEIPFENADFAEQSILTTYISESILHGLGWKSEMSRKKLGLASILYDSMLANEDMIKVKSLEDPNLQMFTKSEIEAFKRHPILASTIASNFQGYTEAEFVIAQHHEKPDGSGFPNGLLANRLSAHSCTFILATQYVCRFANSGQSDKDKVDIMRALKAEYNVGNFKEPLKALEKAIIAK